jgi:hypothetical protein
LTNFSTEANPRGVQRNPSFDKRSSHKSQSRERRPLIHQIFVGPAQPAGGPPTNSPQQEQPKKLGTCLF